MEKKSTFISRSKSEDKMKYYEKKGFENYVFKLRKDYDNSNRYQQIVYQEKSKSLKKLPGEQTKKKTGKFL